MYPFNWPLSKELAKFGIPLLIIIKVEFDKEANVYIATSPSVKGLVVEAETLDEIKNEVELVLPELLSIMHKDGNSHDNRTCLQFNASLYA